MIAYASYVSVGDGLIIRFTKSSIYLLEASTVSFIEMDQPIKPQVASVGESHFLLPQLDVALLILRPHMPTIAVFH